jgi:hypothetical protein
MTLNMKPTSDNEFTTSKGGTGIMVSFTKDEMELIGYHCPAGKSFPSWIRSLVIDKIMGERIGE